MLILASISPRRRRLMKEAGFKFKAEDPRTHERFRKGESVTNGVRRHALDKARAVAARHKSATVIGADTVVYFKGKIIGKPKDPHDAVRILSKLSGRTHVVYTGVAVIRKQGGKLEETSFVETTRVTLKKLSAEEIRRYFKRITPLDKAGAYAVQERKAGIVERVSGSFSNAVGLPMEKLCARLGRL